MLQDVETLIVDDNVTNCRILQETVRGWKMRPTLSEGGPQALELLRQAAVSGNSFALVLLDSQMPGMDGFAVAAKIQQLASLPRPALIMLTSAGMHGDAARCQQVGIRSYLNKPVKRSDLLEAIKIVSTPQPSTEKESSIITIHSLKAGRRQLNILLAEDNQVNQPWPSAYWRNAVTSFKSWRMAGRL